MAARRAHVRLGRDRGQLLGRVAERLGDGPHAGVVARQGAAGNGGILRLHLLNDRVCHTLASFFGVTSYSSTVEPSLLALPAAASSRRSASRRSPSAAPLRAARTPLRVPPVRPCPGRRGGVDLRSTCS